MKKKFCPKARSENGYGFTGLVRKRVWEITFFGLKQGQDLENRTAQAHQEFPEVPPPGHLSSYFMFVCLTHLSETYGNYHTFLIGCIVAAFTRYRF